MFIPASGPYGGRDLGWESADSLQGVKAERPLVRLCTVLCAVVADGTGGDPSKWLRGCAWLR